MHFLCCNSMTNHFFQPADRQQIYTNITSEFSALEFEKCEVMLNSTYAKLILRLRFNQLSAHIKLYTT